MPEDLVFSDSTAEVPNQLWRTDITEYLTAEGKLSLFTIRDACSKRMVGCSIDVGGPPTSPSTL